jgi:hypothetical protein
MLDFYRKSLLSVSAVLLVSLTPVLVVAQIHVKTDSVEVYSDFGLREFEIYTKAKGCLVSYKRLTDDVLVEWWHFSNSGDTLYSTEYYDAKKIASMEVFYFPDSVVCIELLSEFVYATNLVKSVRWDEEGRLTESNEYNIMYNPITKKKQSFLKGSKRYKKGKLIDTVSYGLDSDFQVIELKR